MTQTTRVLTLNIGSSSLKAALYEISPAHDDPQLVFAAHAERLGDARGHMSVQDTQGQTLFTTERGVSDHPTALQTLLDWLRQQPHEREFDLVGHRVVFGGNRDQAWLWRVMPHVAAVISPLTGRALAEAALAGVPLIATPAGPTVSARLERPDGRLGAVRRAVWLKAVFQNAPRSDNSGITAGLLQGEAPGTSSGGRKAVGRESAIACRRGLADNSVQSEESGMSKV